MKTVMGWTEFECWNPDPLPIPQNVFGDPLKRWLSYNEAITGGSASVWLVSLWEEEIWTHRHQTCVHTEGRPRGDATTRQPSARYAGSPQEKPDLPIPWSQTSRYLDLGHLASRIVNKTKLNFLCRSCSVCGILWCPRYTDKDVNRPSSKDHGQITHKHTNRCSASLGIRETQIQTMTDYPRTTISTATRKRSDNVKGRQEPGEAGSLSHCWWERPMIQPLRDIVWQFLIRVHMHLPYSPAITILDIHPQANEN